MANARPRRQAAQWLPLLRVVLVLLPAAGLLAGCSSTAVTDMLPGAMGGLPEDAPARPAQPAPYQPVNAPPPSRDTPPLTVEEQKKLENELNTVRDRQAAAAASQNADPANSPPAPVAAPTNKDKKTKPAPKKPTLETSNAPTN